MCSALTRSLANSDRPGRVGQARVSERRPTSPANPRWAGAQVRSTGFSRKSAARPPKGGTTNRPWTRCIIALAAIVLVLLAAIGSMAARAEEPKPKVRELYVPFDGLAVLLEGKPRRVMLSREEYQQLQEKAKKTPQTHAPRKALVVSADYLATAEQQRARLSGSLVIDVLEDGLHALPLDLSDVGLRAAVLDGKPAAIGGEIVGDLPSPQLSPEGRGGSLTLFVEGKGRHELMLEMVAPLETTAATQVLTLQLPHPPATKLALVVPGDVEVKSGADVAGRVVDEAAGVTRFDLLPRAGRMSIVMTLNSHFQRRKPAVTARSLVVDEVTQAYERLHASVRLFVLHQAVDRFRFAVPEGFDITEVSSPLLARWAMAAEDGRRVLDVKLREQTTETVTLELTAVRTPPRLEAWKMPRLEPLDVVGQVAVLGLLTDEQLRTEAIATESLIPIDTDLLRPALPASVFRAEPGAPSLTLVAAYYAPRPEYALFGPAGSAAGRDGRHYQRAAALGGKRSQGPRPVPHHARDGEALWTGLLRPVRLASHFGHRGRRAQAGFRVLRA